MSDIRREIVGLLPRLRRLAWVIARDAADSDDLLQRTIERALERGQNRRDDARLDLWMFRIMKNLWIDEMRSRNRWGRLVEPMTEEIEAGAGGSAEDEILDVTELARLRSLVEDLPEEQRLAVKLVLIGGHSYAEAAGILEVPEGTLTSRLARGRAALLRHYGAEGTRH
ncbi:sigma-70 family RNA polymerase sigma factor [Novosphingobium sp. ZN18A2]|uniref:sigma-70 family RNA polymerase sigma factor n=1 Tax=Novosphingobium sp. ZN18A2 TaxID=3079861 RepID=UPI0030D2988F